MQSYKCSNDEVYALMIAIVLALILIYYAVIVCTSQSSSYIEKGIRFHQIPPEKSKFLHQQWI